MRFGIFIYDGVEPIDLATFGVLSMAQRIIPEISITTIAPRPGPIELSNGLVVMADYGITDAPELDVLIITGGPGWKKQVKQQATLRYIRKCTTRHLVASVCTGAMILAETGALSGHKATTKQEVIEGQEVPPLELLSAKPGIEGVRAQFVDCGSILTGGGVSLCIDTTLHVLKRMLGPDVASETARIIEYTSAFRANEDRLGSLFD